jgi:hypothetical protein
MTRSFPQRSADVSVSLVRIHSFVPDEALGRVPGTLAGSPPSIAEALTHISHRSRSQHARALRDLH